MGLKFDEAKATEAAALFLRMRGGRMSYMKLIKLLYLADREALSRWGIPITTDRYVSMDDGPVVSNIYNLIVNDQSKPFWSEYISPPLGEYEVQLLSEAPIDKLSRAEEKLIAEIFEKYGSMRRWDLVKLTHDLPEWTHPHGTSTPIPISDILKAQGMEEGEIRDITRELFIAGQAEGKLQPGRATSSPKSHRQPC